LRLFLTGMEEGHVFDLLPGYALGILDEEERQQAASHLAGCELCRQELQRHQDIVAELPLGMTLRDPPPGLRARILREARQERQRSQPAESWASKLRRLSPAWGLVSLALVVVLAVSNLFLYQRLRQAEGSARASLPTLSLNSTDFAPQARGLLVISRDGASGVLVVDELPVLDEARQYQLWLVGDGGRTSGGVFSVTKSGYGWLWIRAPQPLIQYQSFGVTIEPAGGSPGPTGEKVLGGGF
jgi:anti-sigma-K factor RskA